MDIITTIMVLVAAATGVAVIVILATSKEEDKEMNETFYTVRCFTGVPYRNQRGDGSFVPIPMLRGDAERVASETGGRVQIWQATLAREYAVPHPALPSLRIDEREIVS